MPYAILVLIVVIGTALVTAQDDTCTRYGSTIDVLGTSCADIYNKNPTSHGRSGHYALKTDHLFFAYCDMELYCGGNKGGWMRIVDIDTSRGDACPSGWIRQQSYCTAKSAGCYSVYFPTNSTTYSKICGRIVGYEKGGMDGFYPSAHAYGRVNGYTPVTSSRSLDGVYVDGISITSGNPRKHVWTYAVGLSDNYNYPQCNCPCAKYPGPDPPTFVGSHYYCESGSSGKPESKLHTNDKLWDGSGCGPENNCCYDVGMPWFFRAFPTTTTGDIEIRICQDQAFSDEGVLIEQAQIYIQ